MSTIPGETKAIAKPQKTIDQWLRDPGMIAQFGNALPSHMTPERFARIALTALNRSPGLRQCTQESLMQCLLDMSSLGLEPDSRRAHLIPFKDTKNNRTVCTLIVDYKGYVDLVRRSGMVSKIHADVVCDGDVFEHNMGEIVRHTYDLKSDRDDATWYAVYATVQFKDCTTQAVIMTRRQVEKIRDKSPGWIASKRYGKPHPWGEQPAEMAKKTAFRRLTKWLTLSPEIAKALDKEDEHEARVIDLSAQSLIATQSGNDRLAALLDVSDASPDYGDAGPTADDLSGNVDHMETETTSTTTK